MSNIYKVSEVKIIYHPKVKASERLRVYSSADVYKLLIDNFYDKDTIEHKESFKVVLLNQANKVLGVTSISEGGISETTTDIRIILQAAILSNASGIILSHNHPSGNIQPSGDDNRLTQRVKEAANIMKISLLDHLIISNEAYYSFTDEGLI
ncbi:JAB domain-containing protein [Bacteroides sedimenti]|uniref:DNA repair protein n=1 Tax=Bacteroides sedimenti TaxID=2136147 RepID=A0ABM8ICZ1_9BACE